MTNESTDCPGTRQPTVNRFRRKPTPRTGDYGDRYGYGYCVVCGKAVTCHKDKSAVRHKGTAPVVKRLHKTERED